MLAETGSSLTSLLSQITAIVGSEGLLHLPQELVTYECDAYTLEKHSPDIVVLPKTTDEVVQIVKLCRERNLPIIPRGAGTSLSGAVLPVTGGVMIALTRMNKVISVDVKNRRALVEAGCVNAWITNAVKAHELFYAPDPSSQTACTIGGNVATNSGGPHTLKYGVTTNHVLGFELVLPSGELTWLGTTPDGGEDVDGYDLRGAVIGSEGMFGVVTKVLVKLIPAPEAFKTMLGVFNSVDEASQTVSDIIAAGIVPGALEMMDQLITQAIEAAYAFGFPLDAGAVLIIELDGLTGSAADATHAAPMSALERQAALVQEICRKNGAKEVRVAKDAGERALLWKCRKRAFGAIGRLSPNFLTQDGVVPR
ncbi:MAG: putative FAD-linked oxidoreductase, partial [Verrucomicrobiales bacterium]|nr:putative FAD-linked oxidoreductase [Verrucomicrobiales bacterium]